MEKVTLRAMRLCELKKIYGKIEQDFVPGEYAPYAVLYRQLQSGILTGYILLLGDTEAAYAICAESEVNQCVLLSLLGVYRELRGKGIGSAFLKALGEQYSDKDGIIVEVEMPEHAQTAEEKVIREKRIRFYEKAGFSIAEGIAYTIWDIPMYLMTLPIQMPAAAMREQVAQSLYEIYLVLMGKQYIHKFEIAAAEKDSR